MATTALSAYKAGQRSARAKSGRRKKSFTLPVAVVGGFAPMGFNVFRNVQRIMAGDVAGGMQGVIIHTTGYNTDTNSMYWPALMMNYGPVAAGVILHKLANKLGINRALSGAGVPIFRI